MYVGLLVVECRPSPASARNSMGDPRGWMAKTHVLDTIHRKIRYFDVIETSDTIFSTINSHHSLRGRLNQQLASVVKSS